VLAWDILLARRSDDGAADERGASGDYSTPVYETHFIVSPAECRRFPVALTIKAQTPKALKTRPVSRFWRDNFQ